MIRVKVQKSIGDTAARFLSNYKTGTCDKGNSATDKSCNKMSPEEPEPHRDVSWPLQRMRAFFSGREYVPHHIYKNRVSSYSPPLPSLPRSTKISEHFYLSRHPMSEVVPPKIITPEKVDTDSDSGSTAKTPGPVYGDTCTPCSYKAR